MPVEVMRYELKPCTDADRTWAYALKCEVYRDVVERQFGPWDEKRQREFFDARWNPAISRILLVDGAMAGLLAVEHRVDHVWLDEIQISREWRGKGLGTSVLIDLLSQARRDLRPVKLQVLKKNSRARALYERLGFAVSGETQTHHLMESRTAIAEEKQATDR